MAIGIFVDDGQDFHETEYMLLLRLCAKTASGLPKMFVFYDDVPSGTGWPIVSSSARRANFSMPRHFSEATAESRILPGNCGKGVAGAHAGKVRESERPIAILSRLRYNATRQGRELLAQRTKRSLIRNPAGCSSLH
ncbi:MAG: hypothetical protein M3N38_03905 [Pseudomonadota bacterium]|nr:hypothetical protein [Pseudomonadota bacterium]